MAATTILERASLHVLDYRCTEPPGAPGFVEHHRAHALAYVRSGSFGYQSRGRRHELVAGSLLIGRPATSTSAPTTTRMAIAACRSASAPI